MQCCCSSAVCGPTLMYKKKSVISNVYHNVTSFKAYNWKQKHTTLSEQLHIPINKLSKVTKAYTYDRLSSWFSTDMSTKSGMPVFSTCEFSFVNYVVNIDLDAVVGYIFVICLIIFFYWLRFRFCVIKCDVRFSLYQILRKKKTLYH